MITLELDRAAGASPLYMQLYQGIRALIVSGELAAGERLPSKKKLAAHLQVSVKTVENAYFQLALEGYVTSREKVGYFVGNLQGFYRGKAEKSTGYQSKYREEAHVLDVKANNTPVDMFPLSVWSRIGREVVADEGRGLLETVPFNGVEELRRAIADHLAGFRGMHVSPDQVVVGSGTEYLYRRLTHLLGEGCVLGMEDPGYGHIKKILQVEGIPLRCIPMDESGIRPDLLDATDCTAVHLSPMHHFPMGTIMPVQRRIELLQWANRAPGRYIVEDDYNCEYLYQGAPISPLFEMDVRQRVVYMNTFSKTIAPSVRVAYLVLPERLMDRYLETMSFYSCTVSSETQHRLARFISQGHLERHIHRVRQHNIDQRRILLDGLAASRAGGRTTVLRNVAGTHFLVRLDTARSDREVGADLAARGILASFVSEYCEGRRPELDHLLIVNYSRITPDDVGLLGDALDAALG